MRSWRAGRSAAVGIYDTSAPECERRVHTTKEKLGEITGAKVELEENVVAGL